MANTNIKLFDENKSNMMSDIDYGKDTQRANGVQTGVASSQLQNKFQYQMSLMAYAVAQLMIANGYDAMDSAAVSTFVGNFSNSVVQKVRDKASASEAAAGTNDLKWISAKQLVNVATSIANKAAKGMVKYNTPQSLTDAQKQQARDNINAPAPYEAGDNISITGRVITTKAFPCNPNLLDNWYFGNPVNQRGQTSYAGVGYTVDRWKMWQASGTVTIENGGIVIRKSSSEYVQWGEVLEADVWGALVGRQVTMSALTVNGQLATTTQTFTAEGIAQAVAFEGITFHSSGSSLRLLNFVLTGAESPAFLAVKLELGPEQTLAHQENGAWVLNEIPDYGEQLRRCQRYFARLSGDSKWSVVGIAQCDVSNNAVLSFWLPVPMRARPSIVASGLVVNQVAVTSISADQYNPTCFKCNGTLETNVPAGIYVITQYGDGYVDVSADL